MLSSVTALCRVLSVNIMLTISCCRAEYFLVVVQELVSYADSNYDPPLRDFETYLLQELQDLTRQYDDRIRGRRQALNEGGGVYIAANISEDALGSGFMLGDSMMYGEYVNHPLTPKVFYMLALRGTIMGTDTPIFIGPQDPVGIGECQL